MFTAEIIYHLFDKFTAYMADVKKEKQARDTPRVATAAVEQARAAALAAPRSPPRPLPQEKAARTAVFPVIAEISSPEHVWCRGGGGDPILVGLHVKEGLLKARV